METTVLNQYTNKFEKLGWSYSLNDSNSDTVDVKNKKITLNLSNPYLQRNIEDVMTIVRRETQKAAIQKIRASI